MSYTCGTGAWSGPLPGDPDTNAILTATPVFGGIDVAWTDAVTNPHAVAHTYLYRSTSADFATAARIAKVGGTFHYDKLDTPIRYYYWIQIVSINGTIGEVIGPASAIPRLSIDETIQALTGRIDSGVLAQSLKQEIDKISLINGDLFQEIQDRIAANELLGAAIQVAQTDASQAVSIIYDEITQRTTAYDVLLQSLNTMAGQVNDTQAAIQNESTIRINSIEALAQQVTDVQSVVGDDFAAVQTTLQTNIDIVDGKVTDIGALYTAVVQTNGLIGGFGIYNDGTEVQAGFDVDTFWVGRTGLDKKKPFIIDSTTGEVFINNAVINKLTADKIDSRNLTIKNDAGEIIFGAGNNLDWSRVANKTGFASISKITPGNVTTYIDHAAIGNAQFGGDLYSTNWTGWGGAGWKLERSGNIYGNNIYARGDIQASSLKANTLMVNRANIVNAAVDTLQINGEAVVIPRSVYTAGTSTLTSSTDWQTVQSLYINAEGSSVATFAKCDVSASGNPETGVSTVLMRIAAPSGATVDMTSSTSSTGTGQSQASHVLVCIGRSTEVGTYLVQVQNTVGASNASRRALVLIGTQR